MSYLTPEMLPVEVNVDQWTAQLRQSFFPLEISVDRSEPFAADVLLNNFSHCKFATVKANAHTCAMSSADCNSLTQRYIKVIWQQEGAAHLGQGGREVDITPGHWTVYEASRPYEIHSTEDTAFTVFLCETSGQEGMVSLAQRAAGRSMRTEGGAAIALSTLAALRAEGNLVAPHSCSAVIDFVTSLLSRELQFSDGGNIAAKRRAQEALLRDAQHYLRRNLGRHDLSPDQIAAALHVSRRTLYHAFELAGETPQALIQRLRLEQCRDVLSHAGSSTASITQLALEFGFADPAYFTRVFRQRFGRTPSQYRAASKSATTLVN